MRTLLSPLAALVACAQTAPPVTPPSEAVLAKVPEKIRTEARTFYRKTLDIQGLPVMAAASVADEALVRTHEIVSHVLAGRPDILKAMATVGTRLLIIGKDQVYTDLPDYKDMPNPAFWNERVRGTGGDDVTSFGEENLLNLPLDRYDDMSVGLHEFAHTIDAILARIDAGWPQRLEAAHRQAVARGLFFRTYAGSNPAEYWAEGVTMYFDCERPNNWNHGPIATREALRAYDPVLYDLVRTTLRLRPDQDWRLRPMQQQPSIVTPPPALKADPAYVKFTLAREFPVLGTARVSDTALLKANDTIRKLFAYRHDVLKALIGAGARLVVLGRGEQLCDLPEFQGKRGEPAWDHARELPFDGTHKLLVVSEENVLGLPGDPFAGACRTIHLFAQAAHAVTAARPVDPTFGKNPETTQQYELYVQRLDVRFDRALKAAFDQAKTRGLWRGTSAARDRSQYFAMGVSAYFDGGGEGQCPVGTSRPITTREALKGYDPGLYRIVDEVMAYGGHVDWRFKPAPPAAVAATPLGTWLFPVSTPYPGLRTLELVRKDGQLQGTLTTDWYGPMALHQPGLEAASARFGIHNGNPRLPMHTWTATALDAHTLRVTGRIWDETVDLVARRATSAEVTERAFAVQALPPWQPLQPDGLAQTPPMGWSSWNKFAERIDDATVRAMADHMVSSGLRDAGYRYVNIDDGWQGRRDEKGVLHPNERFPDMKALADYVHARGLKLGLYSSPGPKTCAGFEGSYGHVEQDAQTWAAWGIDYLKYDLCSGEGLFLTEEGRKAAYLAMGQALRRTGRPIVYSLCQYGRDRVGTWGRQVGGHLWRTTGDITDDYETMARLGFDKNGDPSDAGPGGWNDPDMLEVGNGGMSLEAYRTHMTLWALSAAPLLMGHDLRTMTPDTLALLTNPEVLAIDQDPLGRQGRRVRREGDLEVWCRPLADGSFALAAFNRGKTEASVELHPRDAGLGRFDRVRAPWTCTESPFRGGTVKVQPQGVFLIRAYGPRAAS